MVASDLNADVTADVTERGAGRSPHCHKRFLRTGIGSLIAVGVLLILATVWWSSLCDSQSMEQRSTFPFGTWILQCLVTGNLAICLLWVWLDRFAICYCSQDSGTRDSLYITTLLVALVSNVSCLCIAGMRGDEQVIAILIVVSLPVLTVAVPLLWLAVGRMASFRLRTLTLVGFVVASSFAQERAKVAMAAGNDMSLFVVNSYLIGLAIAIWLLASAIQPRAGRIA